MCVCVCVCVCLCACESVCMKVALNVCACVVGDGGDCAGVSTIYKKTKTSKTNVKSLFPYDEYLHLVLHDNTTDGRTAISKETIYTCNRVVTGRLVGGGNGGVHEL